MANTTPSDSKSPAEEQLDQAQLIEETGSVRTPNAKHLIHCLNIIGQVEGHNVLPEDTKTTKYEHVLPALVAIEQDRSIEGLLILLNTMGGDVEAGLAIAEVIAGMQTPTVSLVVGGGHSIGIPLAVSADVSLIVPSASMTVHPVRYQRAGAGRAADNHLLFKNSRAYHRLHHQPQPHFQGSAGKHDAEHTGNGNRHGNGHLRYRSGGMRADRPAGFPPRCH